VRAYLAIFIFLTSASAQWTATGHSASHGTGVLKTNVSVAPIVVTISPTYVAVAPGATQQFNSTVTGSANTAVNWTASPGSISSSGLYTAPAGTGTASVTTTSAADPTKSASAVVSIQNAATGMPWAGILANGRARDWSTAGIPGGIPHYTAACQTVSPTGFGIWQANTAYAQGAGIQIGAGGPDTMIATTGGTTGATQPSGWPPAVGATIQDGSVTWTRQANGSDAFNISTALAQCGNQATGQVVQLETGTYTATGSIDYGARSRVVLRGAGPKTTKVIITALGNCGNCAVSMRPAAITGSQYTGTGRLGGSALWAGTSALGTYNIGDTRIIVGPNNFNGAAWDRVPSTLTPSGPGPGALIFLDQRDDQIGICPVNASGVPNGTGPNCAPGGTPVYGLTESGTTVTVTTSLPHGFQVGQCVGIGTGGGAYNSLFQNNGGATCGGMRGWLAITAVPSSTTFQYTAYQSGLADSGGGFVTWDTGGWESSKTTAATVGEGANRSRSCATGVSSDPNASAPGTAPNPNPACQPGEISFRTWTETKLVTAVTPGGSGTCPANYTCYDIDPPIERPNWRTSQAPGVWWGGVQNTNDGIEDMTLEFADPVSSGNFGIRMQLCLWCWVKNVRGIHPNRAVVRADLSLQDSIRDNYFFGTKGGASQSYMVELSNGANDVLVENNIFQAGVAGMMTGQSLGSVYAYNYALDSAASNPMGGFYTMFNINHSGAEFMLAESNNTPGITSDHTHATGSALTMFRNRGRGFDYPAKNVNSSNVLGLQAFTRGVNYIGNIWGSSVQTLWQAGGGGNDFPSIWRTPGITNFIFGQQTNASNFIDQLTRTTQMRWGNYDSVSRLTRWCGDSSSPNWNPVCYGVLTATVGGGFTTSSGTAGTVCTLTFDSNGGVAARGWFPSPGVGTVATGTAITMSVGGTGYTSAPTTAYMTGCGSGTRNVTTTIGPNPSEVPTIGVYMIPGNPVPASTALPPSFYLPGQPPFWSTPYGTPPFPAIGPDIQATGPLNATCTGSPTACDGINNMSYQIPSQICFNHMTIDPGYQQSAPITNLVWASSGLSGWGGGFATVTANNTVINGKTITITGAQPAGYNGTFQSEQRNATSLQYRLPAPDPGAWVSGTGTLTWVNIGLFDGRDCYPNDFVPLAARARQPRKKK
jgi:hypothetical protein